MFAVERTQVIDERERVQRDDDQDRRTEEMNGTENEAPVEVKAIATRVSTN